METAFFWITWGLISFWALKTFYVSFSKEKLEGLRKASLGMSVAVLILAFLPWLPAPSVKSGFMLATEGNVLVLLFLILLVVSLMLLLLKETNYLKLSAILTIANSFLIFIIMYQLRPGTFVLTWYDVAPIVAALFLLTNDVAALLVWQQLQLKQKK